MQVVSALIRATKHGDSAALTDAITSGADLNGTDSQGWTPLFHAAARGWVEGIKILIESGADVNHGQESGFTALFSAVISGHSEAVRVLLAAGASIHRVDGVELVGYAQGEKKPQIVALLDERG